MVEKRRLEARQVYFVVDAAGTYIDHSYRKL